MKAKVELVYDDASKNRQLEAIERGVEKLAKDDKEWTRWNLVNIED